MRFWQRPAHIARFRSLCFDRRCVSARVRKLLTIRLKEATHRVDAGRSGHALVVRLARARHEAEARRGAGAVHAPQRRKDVVGHDGDVLHAGAVVKLQEALHRRLACSVLHGLYKADDDGVAGVGQVGVLDGGRGRADLGCVKACEVSQACTRCRRLRVQLLTLTKSRVLLDSSHVAALRNQTLSMS